LDQGALLFGPPVKKNNDSSLVTVHKYYICLKCWAKLIDLLDHFDQAKIVEKGG